MICQLKISNTINLSVASFYGLQLNGVSSLIDKHHLKVVTLYLVSSVEVVCVKKWELACS